MLVRYKLSTSPLSECRRENHPWDDAPRSPPRGRLSGRQCRWQRQRTRELRPAWSQGCPTLKVEPSAVASGVCGVHRPQNTTAGLGRPPEEASSLSPTGTPNRNLQRGRLPKGAGHSENILSKQRTHIRCTFRSSCTQHLGRHFTDTT